MKDKCSVVLQWIEENKDKLIRLTQELVKIPSITGEEKQVQLFLHDKIKTLGMESQLVYPDIQELRKHDDFFETTSYVKFGYDARPNVFASLEGKGSGPSMCLSGHVDVVSAEPLDDWTKDPWGGEVEGNYIYGRGSGDMKAGVASLLFVIEALKETDTELMGSVFLETTIEEEDGGVGGNLFLRMKKPKPDAAIIPEPSSYIIGLASAGVMYFKITVPGLTAHAATAHFGENAIIKALSIVNALKELNETRQKTIHYPLVEQYPSMKGRSTTINVGVINAGDWPSTVPGVCTIEGRVGWPPGESRDTIMSQIEKAVFDAAKGDLWLNDRKPTVEWFGWRARPHEQDRDDPLVKLVAKNSLNITKTDPSYSGGSAGLDTRYFVHHGTPAVVYGPWAERIHSYDERVSIDSTINVAKVIAATTLDWCGIMGD
ncbi:MAG: ArgE/DapE family deacylase [Candidatus Hodarchaeales archaeon]|jgi:acetylornithine deacetylase